MSHAFISYSRKDSAFVDQLEAELNRRGIETWRDKHNIPGGMAWYQSIVSGLDNAYAMICVVSPNADESRWVLREQLYGDQREIPRLPVLMQPHRIPFHLIEAQPINCAEANFKIGVGQLTTFLEPLQKTALPKAVITDVPADLGTDRLREEYLRFLLSETVADLRDALYVNLEASTEKAKPEVKAKSALSFGLDMEMMFDLKQLGLETIKGEDFNQRGEEVEDAREPIRAFRRVILLGEPGAGKTTTLLKLVVDYARSAQADNSAVIPVFVPLQEFTGEQPFEVFVRSKLGILQEARGKFRLFFLLDALNEMPRKAADGHDLVAEVREFLHDKTDWVVSCRVRDYQDDLSSLKNLGKVRIKPLDLPQIREFITRFYTNSPGLTEQQGDKLWQEMGGSDHLLEEWENFHEQDKTETFWRIIAYSRLAWNAIQHASHHILLLCRNPYMLTIVCRLFGVAGRLPANRGALFQQFVGVLLKREEASAAQIGAAWLESSVIRQGLAQIAYAMGAQTEMPRAEAENLVRQYLPDTNTDLLLRLAVAASLIDIGSDVRFTHQLLQEYFASEVLGAMVDAHTDPRTLWKPENWWEANGREETVIILAGVRGDPQGIARWLAAAQPELAYQVLTKSGANLDLNPLDGSTRQALITSANQKTSEPNPIGRAAAYRVLGLLNADTRSGVGLLSNGLPDIEWVKIPAGKFIYGDDDKQKYPYHYECADRQVLTLPTFHISRYPITYAQFQAFVEAEDGYLRNEWWERLAADDDHRSALGEQEFKYANHPRGHVSWYDAIAFCRWLSAKLGYEVRLPTEQEWEKVARGTDGRTYPYGNDFDVANGNMRETGIGQTSAVGIFPDGGSPYGVMDMSGNVAEWCLNQFHRPEETQIEGIVRRVIRGGGCFGRQNTMRSAYRPNNHPVHARFVDLGFRIVRPPSQRLLTPEAFFRRLRKRA